MIRRTAHKNLEATLLSHSSASTRRPHAARYTTPSKPASAQAALAHAPPRPSSSSSSSPVYVHPPASYTFIPTPLPEDRRASNDQYFPDTGFQDLLAVMNACLHNGYDVRRALSIFEDLRDAHTNHPHFDVRVVNRILAACLDMAEREPAKAALWIDDFYEYLQIARDGSLANVVPNASTYALALRAWLAHGDPETDAFASSSPWASLSSSSSSSSSSAQQPPFSVTILEDMIQRSIDVRDVVTDRAIPSDEVGAAMVRSLIKATTHERVKDRAEFREVALVLVQAEQVARHLQPDALADVEGVRPVEVTKVVTDKDGQVKGEETEVPFNLKVLREHLDNASLFRRMLPEDNLARQYLLERSVLDIASERMRKIAEQIERLGQPPDVKNQSMQAWIWSWHTKLVERLKQDIRKVRREENRMHQGTADQRGRVAPFLELLKVEKLSLITILEIIRLHGTGGVQDGMKTARALVAVGKAVELEYKSELQRKHGVNVPDVGPGLNLHNRRVMARKLMEDGEEWASEWSQIIRVRVGAFLVYRLMDVATVWQTGKNLRTGKELVEEHPAFSHSYEYFRGYKLGTIRVAPMISSAIAKDNLRETLHPRHLPMLVPPAPWLNWQTGGYLSIPSPVMRFKDSVEQKSLLKKAISDNRMDDVLAGLDALGQTPWRINRDVFDVVLKVWNSGERLCKIPPASFDEPEPARDDTVEFDPAARQQYLARLKQWQQDRASNHSDRCSVNYKIEIARAFLNDVFYLPHNLDFRGRAYPLPPHLNHIGNDLSRGLLLFAEGKPLGVRGLRWLKIHLANLYGYDKATFDERVQFVDDRIAEIRDSATNPLDGQGWWKKADDPWQCLSACIQLTRALDSPDPLAYECPLPVHQDGTCNGLQHYAALGGDDQGARQVNLAVAERPSDVYTYVADMVERRIEADLSSDVQKDRHFAGLLAGKIARKVVKQTVMTTVYGVTFVGAREQIEKQLRERGDVPAEDVYFAAAYLAKQVLRCIGDLFKGANSIMNWLTLSARIIAKSVPGARLQEAVKLEEPKGTWKDAKRKQVTSRIRKEQMGAVTWTTLLGLPVVQPYRKIKRKQVNTSIQSVFISDPNVPAEVNSQKQASAFPPNFIHSLDATHMLMTALECQARGMQFAAVHDSYWTHAADIDPMSDVIRDTFIRLHSSDVLSRLDAEFKTRYADHKVPIISTRTASVLRAMGVLSGEAEETVIEASDETADELEAEQELDLKPLTSSADGKRARSIPKPVASADLEDPEDTIDDLGAGDVGALSAMAEEAAEVAAVPQALADAGEMSDEHREELMQLLRKSQSEYPSVTVEPGTLDDARREQQSKMLAGKFVNLVNLLPPLPKKGSFDVTKIKNSLYFFS